MCFLKLALPERAFPHWPHLTFLAIRSSSERLHRRSWLFMLYILKLFRQLEHLLNFFSPCMCLMCIFRVDLAINLEQKLHRAVPFSFASASWLFLWYFKMYLFWKYFRQTSQDKTSVASVFSECVCMCAFRMYLFAKDLEQTLQSARSIVSGPILWDLMWVAKMYLFEKTLEQVVHSKVWSLLSSTFKCFFECASTLLWFLNCFPHFSQGKAASRAWEEVGGEYVGSCWSSAKVMLSS